MNNDDINNMDLCKLIIDDIKSQQAYFIKHQAEQKYSNLTDIQKQILINLVNSIFNICIDKVKKRMEYLR